MIDRKHRLSVTRQATLLGLSRGSVYYLPQPTSAADLVLMRRLDELHLEHPFMGARMLRRQLLAAGIRVGRRHVRTLMRRMGMEALCPQPGTSQRQLDHKIYPYLLRQLAITRANQVWALDTTYIPMARGFVYLTAVVDVASRLVLAHKAFARYGVPVIVNTDQGSQFTAEEFTQAVLDRDCQLSMDGRGAWRDNVFIERLWRSVKYECVYLKAYDGVSAARSDIGRYMDWFNTDRAHSRLNGATPQQAYLALVSKLEEAAQHEIRGAPRVAHRVGRFVASADRRRGQLCTSLNPPGIHL
jgi:putative transposase